MNVTEYEEMRALEKRFSCFDTSSLFEIAHRKVEWGNRFIGVLHHQLIDIENELYDCGYTYEEATSHIRHRLAVTQYKRAIEEYNFFLEQLQSLKRLHQLQQKQKNQDDLFAMRKNTVDVNYPPLTGEQLSLF